MLSKKKLTDIFLRKEDRQEIENAIPFDQNYFQLHCQFSGTNSSLISISATVLKGEKSKEKLNLKCKWYIKTADDFKQIPGINGNFYQPCLDDIGSIISVQIEPFMEDKQYEGITIMKQFGPIKLDPKLQQFQSTISKSKMFNVNLKLQNVSSSNTKYSQLQLPIDGTLIVDESKMQFLASENNEVSMQGIRKTPNSILLLVGQESFRLTAQNSSKRDQLMISIRRFTDKISQTQSQLNYQLRIQQLIKTNNNTRKQLQLMKIQHQYAVKSKSVLQQQSLILKQKMKQFDNIVEQNNRLKAQNMKTLGQNSFYISEISIYKKVDRQRQIATEELSLETNQLKQKIQSLKSDLVSLESKYQTEISIHREQAQSLQRELVKEKQNKIDLQNQTQQKIQQLNRLQRKYANLVSDRSIIDDTKSKKQNMQRQMQVQALKSQIFNLQSLLAKHKSEQKQTKRIWDIKQLLTGLKSSKNNNEATTYLQKLVGNLTETVTQKQLQLVNQKQSNKLLNQQLLKYRSKYGVLKEQQK